MQFKLTAPYRLLQAPFDFSQAFNEALKKIIDALPNRPAKESSEDSVCQNAPTIFSTLTRVTDLLLCLHRQLRRIRM